MLTKMVYWMMQIYVIQHLLVNQSMETDVQIQKPMTT
jgi:hypothetical protein